MTTTYYHVRISMDDTRHDEVKNDLDEEALERLVLRPYRTGESMTINGKTFTWDKVERVRISTSTEPSSGLIERLKAKDRNSRIVAFGVPGYGWRAAAQAQDVTDQFITGPPGQSTAKVDTALEAANRATMPTLTSATAKPTKSAVFVVAGRDSKAVAGVVALLRTLGIQVIEWEQAVAKTGLPNPFVGDVVETGLRLADAALVLLTPDDLVQLRQDLVRDDDGPDEREVRGQARPNVYYEAGIADALGRDRTVIVEIGNVKSFSDAAGRHVVRYDGSPAKRHALAERLRVAGLDVDTTGQDWLTAGDIGQVLEAARSAVEHGTTPALAAVDKEELRLQIDAVLDLYSKARALSGRSPQPPELLDMKLEIAFRAQSIIDRFAADTPYGAEAEDVRKMSPDNRLPKLIAALKTLRAEVELAGLPH